MTYRSDDDALLARATALDRENAHLQAELGSASDERDDLRDKLRANERELKKLRKKLAKHEKPSQRRGTGVAISVAVAVLGLAVSVGLIVMWSNAEPGMAKSVARPEVAESSQNKGELSVGRTVRWCLDTTDFTLRMFLLIKEVDQIDSGFNKMRWRFDNRDNGHARACGVQLSEIEDNAPPGLAGPIKAYREALAALRPVVVELDRYVQEEDYLDDQWAAARNLLTTVQREGDAYTVASDALREVYMPVFHRVRNLDQVRSLGGASSDPMDHDRWRATALATDLMDAVFATNLSFERVDEAMTRIKTFRAGRTDSGDEPAFAVPFYTRAKDIHRTLRERGDAPELTHVEVYDLATLIDWYQGAYVPQQPVGSQPTL